MRGKLSNFALLLLIVIGLSASWHVLVSDMMAQTPTALHSAGNTASSDDSWWLTLLKETPITAIVFFLLVRMERRVEKLADNVGGLVDEVHQLVTTTSSSQDSKIQALVSAIDKMCEFMRSTHASKKG